jgi:recombination protein RecA
MPAASKKTLEQKKEKITRKKVSAIRDKISLVRTKKEKLDALMALAGQVNKALGNAGHVFLGTEQREFVRLRTGITALDYVCGGGLVRGQMIQFTGGDSSFKTSAAMMCVASVQSQGGSVVWVAGEGFDKKWAKKLGVDLSELIVITADTGDQMMEAAITMIESGLVDLMVFDSFQSLGTTREMEAGVDDESYAGAGAPQMWGRVMRKAYSAMNAGANTAMIGISQVRAPIGKFSPRGAPEPEGSGIWALKHWKAIDIYFRKGESEFEGDASEKRRLLSREFKMRCMKNKTAQSERQASFLLKYENGYPYIDNKGTLFRLARAYGLIKIKGAWYEGYGIRTQGEEKFYAALEDDEDAIESMEADLFDLLASE